MKKLVRLGFNVGIGKKMVKTILSESVW